MALKLDLGCGNSKREGFTGVDARSFPAVDIVCDLAAIDHTTLCSFRRAAEGGCTCPRDHFVYRRWPWDDESVDEAHSSHFVEHLDARQRMHFANELWRVLKPEATAMVITPYAFSERAYGDLTHQWPGVVGFWFLYLDETWRKTNAPHNDYACNFSIVGGHNPRADLRARNPEYIQEALATQLNASDDMFATFTKKPRLP